MGVYYLLEGGFSDSCHLYGLVATLKFTTTYFDCCTRVGAKNWG